MTDSSRYSRQMVLPQFGRAGQERLASAATLVVGSGALGSIHAELLARAGVGRIVIADRDIPEMHNLQRQMLFDEADVEARTPKATAAARKLRRINSSIAIEEQVTDVTSENIEKLLKGADIVLDGTDNFDTRYLINDACVKLSKPWIYGGVLGTGGMMMPIEPGKGPCLRCVMPDPPDAVSMPNCETNGVLNTVVMTVAAMQVTEALRILLGHSGLEHSLRMIDLWSGEYSSVKITRETDCPACGRRKFDFLDTIRGARTTVFCGRNAVQVSPGGIQETSLENLAKKLEGMGTVRMNGILLEAEMEGHRMIVFPDGRVLVMGTTDPALARTLVARYVGC